MDSPSLSVVIPNLHSPLIGEVVHAVERQTARAHIREIIVVGQDRYGQVPASARFIATPQPVSASAARNLGAAHASGQHILFIDADCVAAPDLAERILACHADGHPVVGGSVALEGRDYWALCDNLIAFAPFLEISAPGPRAYLPSLNFSIRRALLKQAGGFDQRFLSAAGEDYDLTLRLRQLGYTLWFEPRAVVYHRHPRSSARSVWAHLQRFGRTHVTLLRVHGSAAAPRIRLGLRPWAGLIMAAAPLLALWDIARFYRRTPQLWGYWWALPGAAWAKLAWYWGVAEGLLASRAR